MRAPVNGVEIEYESFGPEDGETLLLIMGLGRQLTAWPTALCERLAARGLRVVRYDNRDAGLSWRSPARFSLGEFMAARASGQAATPPYTLSDMAADAAGLLDHLGVAAAHVAGVSMGGMIGQLLAVEHPARVRSLTSIMSTTGNPALPTSTPEAAAVLLAPPPNPADPAALADAASRTWAIIGSPAYPTDDAVIRARALADAERGWNPAGTARQLAAVMHDGDRRARLAGVAAPTVVLHGTHDTLIPVEGGRDTAASIPGAELIEIEGMGHDLPEPLLPRIERAILRAVERGRGE